MSIINTLRFIIRHPLNRANKMSALGRFFKWQLGSRFNSFPIIYPFTERSKLIIKKGLTGATGNLYCGLHEFEDMSFLLHFLRKNDRFVDIGANVGSYTILASAHAGAESVSFEPVPSTYQNFIENIAVNNIGDKVIAFNIALGAAKGTVDFTSTFDTVNHVADSPGINTIRVELNTLDEMLEEKMKPVLIKIDVEGFETEVIKGAGKTLRATTLKAIIIELNGSGKRYGYDEAIIDQTLRNLGFGPFTYHPFSRDLRASKTFGENNTIYIRDLSFVENRIKTADNIKVSGYTF